MFALFAARRRISGRLFLLGLIALLGVTIMMSSQVIAQTAPNLGTAASFAVLGSSTVTNTSSSIVNGDLGVSPGSAVTGFPPGVVTPPGTIHAADAVANQAQIDATAAYGNLAGQPCSNDLSGTPDITGQTLVPGVYCFLSTGATLTGALTLDALGDPNAVWVFQMSSTLITGSGTGAVVNIVNGGSGCNVWWQVSSSATLGTSTSFEGNILALASITMQTNASLSGRALVQTGAVTMDSNTVGSSACVPVPVAGLSLTKDDGGVTVAPGGTISYTLNYQNTGSIDLNNVTLTDTIPAGTTFNAGASTPGWNCAVSPCTFDLGTLVAGAGGSAVFAVTVDNPTSATEISNNATITSGATTATASDTTPVTTQAATTVPPDATGVPPDAGVIPPDAEVVMQQTAQALATMTAGAAQANAGSQPVIGLPDTGGGPPQPTYWIGRPGR